MLDLLNNIRLTTVLFGRFLEKKIEEGMPFVSHYTEEFTDESDIKFNRLVVKHDTYTQTVSMYYHNKCLKFIDMIFLLDGDCVELANFDSTIDDD